MEADSTDQIEAAIRELKKHHAAAPYRIQAHYHDPDVTQFETAPHNQQFQQAAAYLDYVISEVGVPERNWDERPDEKSIEWIRRRDWSKSKLEDMIYGITMELLVSAAHLKIRPREYLSELVQTGKTPRVSKSKMRLLDDLLDDLPSTHVEEIKLVLELAKEKRDNLVHFGFHYQGAHYFPALFIDVSGFIITRYADTDDIPELETMAEFREAYDQQRSDAELYPEVAVGFDPF